MSSVKDGRAVFLLVHGLGAHAGRWEALTDFFRERGISSYAVELRDFDRHPAGHGSFRDNYKKIERLYDAAARDNPGKKIFLIGESMGALIAFLFTASRPALFNGLVCISPAFANRYKPAFLDSVKMALPLFYNPEKEFKLPFDSSMCTRDAYYRKKLDEDPREYRSVSSRVILEILMAQAHARFVRGKIAIPVLFLLAGEDKLVDPAASKKIFTALAVKDKTLVEFPRMYHSLSIEIGKEKVFEEILKWVEKRIGGA